MEDAIDASIVFVTTTWSSQKNRGIQLIHTKDFLGKNPPRLFYF
jgi:hypothetical protein